jgi:heat shock protein HtpX
MWELIRANRRKSFILFIVMGICLLLIGALAGEALFGQGGGTFGLFAAAMIWFILSLVSYFSGSKILLTLSNAKEVTSDVHPQLFNVVEEMKIAANLPAMPKVYIINEQAPNAFATGKDPSNCAIAVTAGLLARLNRDELQGVIAHEMSHIMNRDVAFMSFAGIMLGSIVLISEVFLRGMWLSGGGSSRRYSSNSGGSGGGGQAQVVIIVISIAFAILAPILAQLLYFAISRKREYLADACGVRLSRYPEGLASALEKISTNTVKLNSANKVTAGMYIVNTLKLKGRKLSDLTSTHPPISERVKILRGMTHGVSYLDYQDAFKSVKGAGAGVIPSSELKKEKIEQRKASVQKSEPKSIKKNQRDLGDIMMKVNKYLFLVCVCGLRMKVPPDYKHHDVQCPKCGKMNEVPLKELAALSTVIDSQTK